MNNVFKPHRSARPIASGLTLLAILASLFVPQAASAWVLTINTGSHAIYLQVGEGTNNGDNGTVNEVSVTVPGTANGTGPLTMTTDSAVSNSFLNGFATCNPPQELYVGAYHRRPNNKTYPAAVLSVTTPANLTNGAQTIPFSQISWTSTANPGSPVALAGIPSGTFTGGSQTLVNITRNTWVENCLIFQYANSTLRAAGTYTGTATFSLVSP